MPVPSDNLTDITDRPNYYAGQYLLEDDFEQEQRYHLDRLRRHHRLLHVAGIVQGLEVSWADSPANTKLQVTAGTAIDADGRQIVLDQTRSDIVIPATIATTGGILFIRYESNEDSTQGTPTSQPGASAAASNPMEGKNRIKERPVIACETAVPTGVGAIVLARVSTAKALDFSDRAYSGLRFPSPFNTPGQGLTLRYKGNGQKLAADQLELAEFTGNLSVTGTLAVTGITTLTGRLTVNSTVSFKGSLNATGLSVDASGNVSMGGTLAVTGTSTIGNDTNASFILAPSDASPNAGYIRFGDNTGWKLHFARSKESGRGTLNTGTTGILMTIQDNGNVGIGTTTTVTEKLEVNGNIKILGSRLKSKDDYGILQANATDWLRINPDESYPKIALYKPVAIGTGGLAIGEWTEQSQGVLKVTKSAYFATIEGKVGIGTTDPGDYKLRIGGTNGQNALHVASDYKLDTDDRLNLVRFGSNSGSDGDYQVLYKASGAFSRKTLGMHVHTSHAFGVYSSNWNLLLGVTGGDGDVYVKGKVGIGSTSTSTSEKLEVNGGIKANGVIKSTGGGLEVYGYMLGTNSVSIDNEFNYRGYLSTYMKRVLSSKDNGSFIVFGPTYDFPQFIMFFWRGRDGNVYRGCIAGELIS